MLLIARPLIEIQLDPPINKNSVKRQEKKRIHRPVVQHCFVDGKKSSCNEDTLTPISRKRLTVPS